MTFVDIMTKPKYNKITKWFYQLTDFGKEYGVVKRIVNNTCFFYTQNW